MIKLALVFSLLSAGFAGYAVWGTQEAAKDFASEVRQNAALHDRITELEKALSAKGIAAAPALLDAPAGPTPPAQIPSAALSGRAPAAAPTVVDLDRRLVEIEKANKEYSELLAKWKAAGGDGVPQPFIGQTAEAGTTMVGPEIYNSVDDAEKHLGLSPAQKAEFERTVEESKRDLEQLKKLPDDEGKTWTEVEKDVVKIDGNSFSFDGTKMQAFREKVIPGRNESFGAAERRISDGAKKRMRDALTQDQQKKFDKAVMPGLVGGGGGAFGGFGDIIFSTAVDAVPADPPAMEK